MSEDAAREHVREAHRIEAEAEAILRAHPPAARCAAADTPQTACTPQWETWFGELEKFVADHGHARPSNAKNTRGVRSPLSAWVVQTRTDYRREQLSTDRITRLEALPGWTWEPNRDDFAANLKALTDFTAAAQAERCIVPVGTLVDGAGPRGWPTFGAAGPSHREREHPPPMGGRPFGEPRRFADNRPTVVRSCALRADLEDLDRLQAERHGDRRSGHQGAAKVLAEATDARHLGAVPDLVSRVPGADGVAVPLAERRSQERVGPRGPGVEQAEGDVVTRRRL